MAQTLKHQLTPYQENGSWYHFFIESDGSAYTLTSKDIAGASISSTYLMMPADFAIVDYKVGMETQAATAQTLSLGIRMDANGKQGVVLPNKANITECDVWVFGYYND